MKRKIVKKATRATRTITEHVTSGLRDLTVQSDKFRAPLYRESARFLVSKEVCPTYHLLQSMSMADFAYATPLIQKLSLCSYETTGRSIRKLNEQANFTNPTANDVNNILDACYINGGPFVQVFDNSKWNNNKKG